MNNVKLISISEILVKPHCRRSKAMLHRDIKNKTFVSPVHPGGDESHKSFYPEHEVDALLAARIAGYSDKQMKELVIKLEQQRHEVLAGLLYKIEKLVA